MTDVARETVRQVDEEALELHERRATTVAPQAWDEFVSASGGSFLGCWRVVRAHRLRGRVRLFEFVARPPRGRPVKVGQCAVVIGFGGARFLDRIHLLRGQEHLWTRCWQLALERCGAVRYEYGSLWNHEEPRPLDLEGAVVAGGAFQIDRVHFAGWSDFGAYRRAVSENIRRDYRKAAATSPAVVTRYGVDALRDLRGLTRMRSATMRRNGMPFVAALDYARHALKLTCLGPNGFVATVQAGDRCRAAFLGARLGGNVYHLAGGTEQNGFGSFLFLTLLERWFAEHPGGNLYLGDYPEPWDPQTYIRGNLLYRRKLRASAVRGVRWQVSVPGRRVARAFYPGAIALSVFT
jgi:alkylated DNA nucleotide flippase Atl1